MVSIREVEEIQANGGEPDDEWSNDGVADGDDEQVGEDRKAAECQRISPTDGSVKHLHCTES